MTITKITDEFNRDEQVCRIIKPTVSRLEERTVNLDDFGNELISHYDNNPSADYCIDMSDITLLSSTALGKLITFNNRKVTAQDDHLPLALAGIKPKIYEVFAITRLNRLFRVYESPDQYRSDPLNPNPQNLRDHAGIRLTA